VTDLAPRDRPGKSSATSAPRSETRPGLATQARAQIGLVLQSMKRPRPVLFLLFCGFAGLATWQILSHSLAAYLGRVAPEKATFVNNDAPDALLRLADQLLAEDRRLAEDGGKGVPTRAASGLERKRVDDEVLGLVQRAMRSNPLNAHGLAILAELAERRGDKPRAQQLLEATVRGSQHESVALYKLALLNIDLKEFDKAVGYLETLLRAEPTAYLAVRPLLVALAENPGSIGAVISVLGRSRPWWRGGYLWNLPEMVQDIRTPQAVFLGLQKTDNPPEANEMSEYLRLLARRNLHGMAYYTWLQFTPVEHFDAGNLLFNGRFGRKPNGQLFDWVTGSSEGATVDFVTEANADGRRGLNIGFGTGRVQFAGVTQVMVLSPGKYVITGKYQGQLIGRRGLRWRIHCEKSGGTLLVETPMVIGTFPDWQQFQLPFTVPDDGCNGQILQLNLDARSASEQIVQGSVWYNDLRIVRKHETN
jgi:tetratricopeptide (TPR) repeat protein